MKKTLIIQFVSSLVIIGSVNLLLRNSDQDSSGRIRNSIGAGMPERALDEYAALLQNDPTNLDLHYDYISLYLKTSSQDQQQADKQLQKLLEGYRSFVIHPESRLRDIGNYCLGLIQSIRRDYVSAMHIFSLVTDSNLKYLNNSIGFIYLQWREYHKAERFFQREIDNQGNLKGAYVNLSQLYFISKNYPALEDLSKNKTAYDNFSFFLKRFLAIGYPLAVDRRHW